MLQPRITAVNRGPHRRGGHDTTRGGTCVDMPHEYPITALDRATSTPTGRRRRGLAMAGIAACRALLAATRLAGDLIHRSVRTD
jgi:hypothetical protein